MLVFTKQQFSELTKSEQILLIDMEARFSLYQFFNGESTAQEVRAALETLYVNLKDVELRGTEREQLKNPLKFLNMAKKIVKGVTKKSVAA